MKNNRNFRRVKLIASTLALVSAVSACSNTKKEDVTPQVVYVYVTATPTPRPEVTEPSVTETTAINDGYWAEDAYIFETVPNTGTQPTINDGNWAEDSYIFETVPNTGTQPTVNDGNWAEDYYIFETVPNTGTQPTSPNDDGWWSLSDEERQFWNNLNNRLTEINQTIDNFSWAAAREDAINEARTLIDFIFHGGTMNGMTFEELTMVGRLEVYSRLQALDSRIMEFYPDYKTDLGELYDRVRSFASTTLERAREIFSGRIDIDINVYPNGETTQNTMNAPRESKSIKFKK